MRKEPDFVSGKNMIFRKGHEDVSDSQRVMAKQRDKRIFIDCIVCMAIGAIVRLFYCLSYFVPVRDAFVYEDYIRQWILQGNIPDGFLFPRSGRSSSEYRHCTSTPIS